MSKNAKEVKGYLVELADVLENNKKTKNLYVSPNNETQLVAVSLEPKGVIELETHPFDQIIQCVKGGVNVKIDKSKHKVKKNQLVVIPAGEKHLVKNPSGVTPAKILMIYGGKVH